MEPMGKRTRPLNYNSKFYPQAQGALCHIAAPSLGHYAPLSFVVIGKGQQRWRAQTSITILRIKYVPNSEKYLFLDFLFLTSIA
jgi:hypothetical protein